MHKDTFFKDVHYNYIFAYSQLGKKLNKSFQGHLMILHGM